jgi:serine/threonine protein kinase
MKSLLYYSILLIFYFSYIESICKEEIKHFPEYSCAKNDLLDKGSTGRIFLIQDKKGTKFVMKVSKLCDRTKVERLALIKLKGEEYVTRIHDSKMIDNKMYIILHYAERGNLYDLIENSDYLKNPKNLFEMFFKIFIGLKNIHKHNMVHADFKLANIVIDKNYDPLIIDFDTMERIGNKDTPRGTIGYMSPEIVEAYENKDYVIFNPNTDLYSFGAMLYYAMKRVMPADIEEYNYFEMMNLPIFFNKGDIQDFVEICFGLLKPLSKRLDSLHVMSLLEKATQKSKYDVIDEDVEYIMQEFASVDEIAVDYKAIKMLLFYIFGLLSLNGLATMIICYCIRKRRKRLSLVKDEPRKDERCSSSDIAMSMTTKDTQ